MTLPRPQIFDILILGAGPAGLNAALTCARTRTTALVLDSQQYRNEGIQHMHTVASRDHFPPDDFRRISREQIEARYDTVWFHHATITCARKSVFALPTPPSPYQGFQITDDTGVSYRGKKLILATGSRDIFPAIPGYAENWPAHIYQCLACDGYEQRGSAIAILGFDASAYTHFVCMAAALDPAASITILTNGKVREEAKVKEAVVVARAMGATLDERRIVGMVNNGASHVEGVTVRFEGGEEKRFGFVVHKPSTVNRAQGLIEELGVETVPEEAGGHVRIVNAMFNETSVRGVFAAGDTMVAMKQVVIAMAEGVKAAAGAGVQISQERVEEVRRGLERKEQVVGGEREKVEVVSH
ncbi:hypothetical protein COCMIDRAFT_92864 [Bipolaris oryzae ATCC 44560]|uniref:FAD/NAD(P)-binding domain-containing protein n=1 Tax=Bipolaris oryzae ATCC 44560 TaxID=930090 RepID=W6Z9G6_COCMI|nr:uncharacterized protein COCMIDRAFT_92864 [Bipolaris oryzae ATCC 44560]EUC46428.1 hypothetical protein COCMIDRAFT_92864 [Bipolaris oryzae ATCC 44560]